MQIDGHTPFALERRNSAHMIHVRVRQPDRIEPNAQSANARGKVGAVVAWVDDDRHTRGVIDDEVAVLLEWTGDECLDLHARRPAMSAMLHVPVRFPSAER